MALPVLNTFAGNPLDRAGDLRNEPDWLAEQAASPDALALVLWDGQPLLEDHADGPRLAWLALPHARDLVPRTASCSSACGRTRPVFAVEVEGAVDPAAGPLQGLGAFHRDARGGGDAAGPGRGHGGRRPSPCSTGGGGTASAPPAGIETQRPAAAGSGSARPARPSISRASIR